jgi:hypothetical protein
VDAPVGHRALARPRVKHRPDRAAQLLVRVRGERVEAPERPDQLAQPVDAQRSLLALAADARLVAPLETDDPKELFDFLREAAAAPGGHDGRRRSFLGAPAATRSSTSSRYSGHCASSRTKIALLRPLAPRYLGRDMRILVEPGRSLVARAGVTLYTVVTVTRAERVVVRREPVEDLLARNVIQSPA